MLARLLFAAVALCLIGALPETHAARGAGPAARDGAASAAPRTAAAATRPSVAARAEAGAPPAR